jgi:predicted  nucleic acid-binding Zn-ribbon protein
LFGRKSKQKRIAMSDAKTLLDLTAVDMALMRIKKKLDELPQRAQLLQLRTKQAEVNAKAQQVAQMRKECEQGISKMQDEEVMLKDKAAEAQKQVDGTNNYKEVAALTKEIESFAKRLEKIEFETFKLMERIDKIAVVEEQVTTALARLGKQDEELHESFQSQGGALKKEELKAQQVREQLLGALPSDLAKRYEKAREAKGGFGAAHVEGSHCSGCRVAFTEGQIAKFRASQEVGDKVSECPYCHRLLVVEL